MAKTIKKINEKEVEVKETSETRSIYNIEELKENRRVYLEKLAIIEEILKTIGELK